MKATNQQQKRRSPSRKPAPSTRGQGKPTAKQAPERTIPPGYQISVRGELPTDLVDRVSLLHATALLDHCQEIAHPCTLSPS